MNAETVEEEVLLTIPQTAERLSVSPDSVRRLINADQLKSVKVLGSRRISTAALRDYLEGLKGK